jgi:hypothetical protein
MSEPVYHYSIAAMGKMLKMPKKTREFWLDITQQAIPDKKTQIVKSEAPSSVVKPLIEAGFLRQRVYGGQAIKNTYSISRDVFYCTTEPTIGEIFLQPN